MPSFRLFGRLPLWRLLPQDVHSVLEAAAGLAATVAGLLGRSSRARAAGVTLGVAVVASGALADVRFSLTRAIPIEAHHTLDILIALCAIAAPFALRYHVRDRAAAGVHVGLGVAGLLGALATDYRARDGAAWPRMAGVLGGLALPARSADRQ
jgi:hypothetical protein